MKKAALVFLALAMMLTLAACGGTAASTPSQAEPAPDAASEPIASEPETASQPEEQAEAPALTAEEQALVGLWEAEDGALVAIRGRGSRESDDFAFDAIHLEPVSGEWLKITRDETTFSTDGGLYTMSDLYMCPDPSDPEGGNLVETEERLEYDPATGTLTQVSRHPTASGEVMEWSNTFTRTDKSYDDPSVEWDWYYEIHPGRKG